MNIIETFKCLEEPQRFNDDKETLINDTFDQLARDNAPNEFQYPFRIKGCDKPAGKLMHFYLSIFPEKRWGYLVDIATKRALMNLSWLDFLGRMNYMSSFADWLKHVLDCRDYKHEVDHAVDHALSDGRKLRSSVGSNLRLNFGLVERPMARKYRFPPEVVRMFFGFISNNLLPSNKAQNPFSSSVSAIGLEHSQICLTIYNAAG